MRLPNMAKPSVTLVRLDSEGLQGLHDSWAPNDSKHNASGLTSGLRREQRRPFQDGILKQVFHDLRVS